jgi:hypothetical protein
LLESTTCTRFPSNSRILVLIWSTEFNLICRILMISNDGGKSGQWFQSMQGGGEEYCGE